MSGDFLDHFLYGIYSYWHGSNSQTVRRDDECLVVQHIQYALKKGYNSLTENDLICPITREIAPEEPVFATYDNSNNNEKSKHIFSRRAIEKWMGENTTDPTNGAAY